MRRTKSDLAVPVRLCKVILQACAAPQAIEVLRKARETVDRVFVGVARRRTVTEAFAARFGEVFLEPGESGLVIRDSFGNLLLRRME